MKILSLLCVCFLVAGFTSSTVFAERSYSVTGSVDGVDRQRAIITVAGKSYRLARTLSVHDDINLREVPPTLDDVHEGDSVGLVFVGSSKKSGIKELWLLSELQW